MLVEIKLHQRVNMYALHQCMEHYSRTSNGVAMTSRIFQMEMNECPPDGDNIIIWLLYVIIIITAGPPHATV